MKNKKYWYAAQFDSSDDWGTGSFDYDKAVEIARKNGCKLIAVIDADYDENGKETSDPICVEEIEVEETCGDEIKKWRSNAMMTQQRMAEVFEIPKRTIENWEQGSRVPADWAAKLVIEKLMRLAEDNIEKRAKIRMDHMKSDEEGRRPAGSWAVIGITKQGDEFIQLYSSMKEAINAADEDYYYDITVGYIICNQTEEGLEAFYCDRDGKIESDFDSVEF